VVLGLFTLVIVMGIVFAHVADRRGPGSDFALAAYIVVGATLAATTLYLGIFTATTLAHHTTLSDIGLTIETSAGLAAIAPLAFRSVREWAARYTSVRPESSVHAVALALFVMVFLFQLGSQFAVDQVKSLGSSGGSPSLFFIVASNQVPMVIVALAGVGLVVKRGTNLAMERLGLVWPGFRWMVAALGVAVGLVIMGFAFDVAMTTLTPQQSRDIQQTSTVLLKNVNTVYLFIILGLAAGIGEELLFRGALQPVFGIIPAAVLFAALHTQYGISLATLEIFVLGCVLGVLRKRAGTTAAIFAHASYDIIIGLLPYLVSYLGGHH
jgi:membrane protease YdiL (CAAX protease family)